MRMIVNYKTGVSFFPAFFVFTVILRSPVFWNVLHLLPRSHYP